MSQQSLFENEVLEKSPSYRGGFPCQPHSVAGKRLASADERDLWSEFARIVCEIKPRWILGENVPGLLTSELGRFFGRVLRDLAQMGYRTGWCSYPAFATGADFQGERVFIVATTDSVRWDCMAKDQQKRLSIFDLQMLQKRPHDKTHIPLDIHGLLSKPMRGILRNDNGVPEALDRLKALGNAVDPFQVYPILAAIAQIENQRKEATP